MMKIAIICDSFKESLSAFEVIEEIEFGFRRIFPDATYLKSPMADGGEGTAEILAKASGGRIERRIVRGPLGQSVNTHFAIMGQGRTAIVEMAEAAGLALVPHEKRDPLHATTYGVGELIRAALDEGCRHIIVALGGSATNDGGAGLAQALGVSLRDAQENELPPGGAALADLARIDTTGLDSRLHETRLELACDVRSPLIGPAGASAVFGPQKGATPEMVATLDSALGHYGHFLEEFTGQPLVDRPGIGAAGGTGASAVALMGAHLRPGADIVVEALGLEKLIADADLVITGEGRIDGQTVHGKAPIAVAKLAKRYDLPVIAIAGSLGEGVEDVHRHGIDAAFSILDHPCTLQEALAEAALNLRRTARNVAATLKLRFS
ncbi:glycerate kinase [Kozakia baliensis]|uniref:glycerate kinase n=1 Tax=Kozakia baliensis TaxID=153496 RepID=UPI000A9DDC02|nr:glycerate kinase [Kozakia baliensis]